MNGPMCHAAEGIISTCSLFSFFSGFFPGPFRLVGGLKFDIASWLITNRSSLVALVIVVTSLVLGDSNGGGAGGIVARVGSRGVSRSVSRGSDGSGVAVGVGGHGGSGVGGVSHGSGGVGGVSHGSGVGDGRP